jgi:aryl-alcohol dehydrogenase-like predicted oxidoreductase
MNPMRDRSLSRRSVAGGLGAAALAAPFFAFEEAKAQGALLARRIPHGNGETLPVIGLGTAVVFNVGAKPEERAGPTAVVRALVDGGATLVDTAPSYGQAETVVGDILTATNLRQRVFVSTKLEEYRPGGEAAEARAALQQLQTNKVDLLQLHNVNKANQDMAGVNALKAQGLCRYTGISTTSERAYEAVEAVVRRAKPDFLEVDYAIDNRKAEERLLPAALDSGTAVLVALPFGRGRLFRTALGKKLPEFASEFDCTSWAQFFLKFVLGHPAITAAIPGTKQADHMVDNLGAGRGRLPDAKQRARMIQYLESLN